MSPVYRGTRPLGWTVEPESWTYVGEAGRRRIAAFMRPIPFDGSQHCLENPLFTSEKALHKSDVTLMRKGCASCPFVDTCRTWALAHEPHDFWAGMTADERVQARKDARITLVHRNDADRHGLILMGLPS